MAPRKKPVAVPKEKAKTQKVTKPKLNKTGGVTAKAASRLAVGSGFYPVKRHRNGLINLLQTSPHLVAV
jgi:hypothetical protein